jgi:hypothetical protein
MANQLDRREATSDTRMMIFGRDKFSSTNVSLSSKCCHRLTLVAYCIFISQYYFQHE